MKTYFLYQWTIFWQRVTKLNKLYGFLPDINTNALTFTKPESYLKQNYINFENPEEKYILKRIFEDLVLINLRTYDMTALIFYVNDHLNNFVHLYIDNGTQVVYLFNHGNEICNITVDYAELNTSKSVQIAIEREENMTTVYVNDKNISIPMGVLLLEEYSNKPWMNPEKGKYHKFQLKVSLLSSRTLFRNYERLFWFN